MKLIINNLDKEEIEVIKSMISLYPENTIIEIGNYAGSISFDRLEVKVEVEE